MKSIPISFCVLFTLCNRAYGRFDINNHNRSNGNNQEFLDYITRAIDGFRQIILQGDQELEYPVMDPYNLDDVSWDHVDASPSKKYRLNLFNKNTAVVTRLANYTIEGIRINAEDLKLHFTITFPQLRATVPYILDGYLFKNIMPVYGDGLIDISTKDMSFYINIDLGIDQSYVIVEDTRAYRFHDRFDVSVDGLMDLASDFANAVVYEILDTLMYQHAHKTLNTFVRNIVEESIGGMTTEEFSHYIEYLAQKAHQ